MRDWLEVPSTRGQGPIQRAERMRPAAAWYEVAVSWDHHLFEQAGDPDTHRCDSAFWHKMPGFLQRAELSLDRVDIS